MMTYLSQFPNAKLKPGAPLRPKTNPNKVRAYGPGKAVFSTRTDDFTQNRLHLAQYNKVQSATILKELIHYGKNMSSGRELI